jgi:site-specific DNA recombinase
MLRCGICGRRLESCWANNRPAHRCRHGYSSAATPDPARPKNAYIREDRILPHLSALRVLLSGVEPTVGAEGAAPGAEPTSPRRSANTT